MSLLDLSDNLPPDPPASHASAHRHTSMMVKQACGHAGYHTLSTELLWGLTTPILPTSVLYCVIFLARFIPCVHTKGLTDLWSGGRVYRHVDSKSSTIQTFQIMIILYNYHHSMELYRKISRVYCRLYCYECAAWVAMPMATNEWYFFRYT